jgi:hypothetical protein
VFGPCRHRRKSLSLSLSLSFADVSLSRYFFCRVCCACCQCCSICVFTDGFFHPHPVAVLRTISLSSPSPRHPPFSFFYLCLFFPTSPPLSYAFILFFTQSTSFGPFFAGGAPLLLVLMFIVLSLSSAITPCSSVPGPPSGSVAPYGRSSL